MTIDQLRAEYHRQICEKIIRIQRNRNVEYPNFADGSNVSSSKIAWGIVKKLGCPENYDMIDGQTAGIRFERITRSFIQEVFNRLIHLRPGEWIYSTATKISEFEQYDHLAYLEEVIRKDRKLEAALRGGYIITPDIVIGRFPVADEEINAAGEVIKTNDSTANLTALRKANRSPGTKILHASISCKWTIRSDRAQNTRTEALNLIRNRKGPLPHIVAVTAEPTPHRLASLALGTGDLDCVYHFALQELLAVTEELGLEDAHAEIQMMIEGKRLRDISDLPFDLAI
jgi:hypothetical protein